MTCSIERESLVSRFCIPHSLTCYDACERHNAGHKTRQEQTERPSPDGKWRSFPKVPNLLQYVSTRVYFARIKVQGKLIRRSLKADIRGRQRHLGRCGRRSWRNPRVDLKTIQTLKRCACPASPDHCHR